VTERILSSSWLDAELDQIWLAAEAELRRLQSLQLRPAVAEVEAILTERRAATRRSPSCARVRSISCATGSAWCPARSLRCS